MTYLIVLAVMVAYLAQVIAIFRPKFQPRPEPRGPFRRPSEEILPGWAERRRHVRNAVEGPIVHVSPATLQILQQAARARAMELVQTVLDNNNHPKDRVDWKNEGF